jgi:hypothetical protein
MDSPALDWQHVISQAIQAVVTIISIMAGVIYAYIKLKQQIIDNKIAVKTTTEQLHEKMDKLIEDVKNGTEDSHSG